MLFSLVLLWLEITLALYHVEYGVKVASCLEIRFFAVKAGCQLFNLIFCFFSFIVRWILFAFLWFINYDSVQLVASILCYSKSSSSSWNTISSGSTWPSSLSHSLLLCSSSSSSSEFSASCAELANRLSPPVTTSSKS